MKRALCLALAGALLFAGSAAAKDFYVKAGKDGDGSKENPFGDPHDALLQAHSGDVIHVARGAYYGVGGGGLWVIDKSDLTLVGGYDDGFAERHPFKNPTILVSGVRGDTSPEHFARQDWVTKGIIKNDIVKASYNGNALVMGGREPGQGHANTVLDGFWVVGHTRHNYKPDGDLKYDVGPMNTPLVEFTKPGCKVRNCVLVNSGGAGVRMIASGTKDDDAGAPEVSNNVILNTCSNAIDFRVGTMDPQNGPDSGYAVIRNNTCAFVWILPTVGEGAHVLVGRQTRLHIEKNVFAYANKASIHCGFTNDKTRLIGNVFWQNYATYLVWEPQTKLTVQEDDPARLDGAKNGKKLAISSKSGGNFLADPGFAYDVPFFDKFTNQIASEGGGIVEMTPINEWRRLVGLPLIGSKGSGLKNFAPLHDYSNALLFPGKANLAALKGAGAQLDGLGGKFQRYSSVAAATAAKDYKPMTIAELKKAAGTAGAAGVDVTLPLKLKNQDPSAYYAPEGKADKAQGWVCFRHPTDLKVYVYVKHGSPAMDAAQAALKGNREFKVSGTAYDTAPRKVAQGVAIVVDSAEIAADD